MSERTLLLARHATTAAYAPGGDLARPLLPTGQEQSLAAGQWLRQHGLVPDLALVSSATRTQQTWTGMVEGTGQGELEAWSDDRIYQGDTADLRAVIGEAPDEATTVLLVGHAPTVPALAYDLTDPDAAGTDREELGALLDRFAPMTIAVVILPATLTSWSDLTPGTATLRSTHPF